MKTAVRTSSIESFRAHKGNGFKGQHGIILAVMHPGMQYSRRQIAKACKLETSTVAARCNEMLASGQIEVCGRMKCPVTGVTVESVKLVSEQMELA